MAMMPDCSGGGSRKASQTPIGRKDRRLNSSAAQGEGEGCGGELGSGRVLGFGLRLAAVRIQKTCEAVDDAAGREHRGRGGGRRHGGANNHRQILEIGTTS